MTENELTAGNTVRLKSGGPRMTIETIACFGMGSTHEQAKCVWFDGNARKEALFELHTLEKE
jgi:uncharacterized protein YodC (DUF2158 family)